MKLMVTNKAVKVGLLYPELSYKLTGILFNVHNELGPYCREKQYCDKIEEKFKEAQIPYQREYRMADTGNIVDFIIDGKIVLETKTERLIIKENYYQVQRYLQTTQLKLGILVNFRNKYIRPVRIVKIDK